ncbi:btb poz domain protein [Diplodia corticola]|uniref:Btb poz domain protein n=1 Tax=Diplodia corticola TaxID=236234 RepID=A0A1J9RXT6_9PEZI|nr:btb poz domain protein [Diplodia corticola]OJD32285.1 btb poz domain protein [Diplodia corticola]
MKIKDSTGHVYNVHKLIVCSQSDFFANAMKDNTFKESHTSLIHLPADDAPAVRAMLQYMYTGTYDMPVFVGAIDAMLLVHLRVYLLADKYAVGNDIGAMSAVASTSKQQQTESNDKNDKDAGACATKSSLKLAELACVRLAEDLEGLWELVRPAFKRIVREVYACTSAERDGALRAVVVAVAAKHVKAVVDDLVDEDDDGGDSEEGGGGGGSGIGAAAVAAGPADGGGEGAEINEGAAEMQDVLGEFGRDLCRVLAKERDELKARLVEVSSVAASK